MNTSILEHDYNFKDVLKTSLDLVYFRMDKKCPNNSCDFKYKAKKKPFKCAICDAYIGKLINVALKLHAAIADAILPKLARKCSFYPSISRLVFFNSFLLT